ncbi:MAG TPA: HIT domain-containing protein, partial [Rhizomicrobium sp.]|nr:HIT domain-containing protein [Rhizomicrobium sp.]
MGYDNTNVFAKILRGEIPCVKLYEDGKTLAFMDVMPQADGHVLVIPRESAENIFDLS